MNNLNDLISIEINSVGFDIVKNSKTASVIKDIKIDDSGNFISGNLEISIWEFSNLFGGSLHQGNTNPPCKMDFDIIYSVHK